MIEPSKPLARYLDAAVLLPEFTREQATDAIGTCIDLNTCTVCVRPCDLALAVTLCGGTETEVCVVLGFPHGVALTESKADEARRFADLGADEIDMVANYGFVRSGMWEKVTCDIGAVVRAAKVPVKVIFETSQLALDHIPRLVNICCDQGAAFVKTSTGFNGEGATEEVVAAMLAAANGRIQVKPSGGIRDRPRAEMFVRMGATRLGVNWTSCHAICSEDESESAAVVGDAY